MTGSMIYRKLNEDGQAGRLPAIIPVLLFLAGAAVLVGAVSPARAEVCAYDVSPLPRFEGIVTRITGEGVLFADGTDLVVPESLMPYMRLEQKLGVYGLKARTGPKVWVLALIPSGPPGDSHGKKSDMGTMAEPVCPSLTDVKKGPYPGSPAYDMIFGTSLASPDRKEADQQP